LSTQIHNRFSRSGRSALWGALLLIGVAALYNWMVAPHVAYLRAVQRLAPAVERVALENERIGRTLGPSLQHLQDLRRERTAVRAGLFPDAEFTTFLRDLPALVEQTGCVIVVADFTGGNDAAATGEGRAVSLRTRQAGLTVRGTLAQITGLLERLQGNRRKVWVDSFRMERVESPRRGGVDRPRRPDAEPRAGSGAEQFKCQLVMTMYVIGEAAPYRSGGTTGPVP
jgi:hypothetical protein